MGARFTATAAPVAMTALISLAVACGVDRRSNAFACDTDNNCDAPRTCQMGFCVTDNASDIDADVNAIDANVNDAAVIDAGPPADANQCACPGNVCPLTCGDTCTDLGQTCVAGCTCNLDCVGATNCDTLCSGPDVTCNVECTGAANCILECSDSAVCEFDCTNSSTCDNVRCTAGASCLLDCTGSSSCRISQCTGGSVKSCANNIEVCNRECP